MLLSIIIPVMNEAGNIPLIISRIRKSLSNFTWELIFVDDGSTDDTRSMVRHAALADDRIRLLAFSRNFGHQAAVTAGLDFAAGDAVIVMDGDLQDPPELLPQMVDLFRQGYDVVSPRRTMRQGEGPFKRWTATAFYHGMSCLMDQRLTREVGDFRLFSRRAVLAMRSLREQHRFLRGMAGWLGLKEAVISFDRPARAQGVTKYSPLKMLSFAWTAVTSFSAFPLRLSMAAGSILSAAGFVYLARVLYLALFTTRLVPGWASIVALQCAFSGIILLALGLAGDYIARAYEEAKRRPLYVVEDGCNVLYPAQMPERTIILTQPEPRPFDTLLPSGGVAAALIRDSHSPVETLN